MKMRLLHIANTDLEFELSGQTALPLEEALRRNPIVHQLQFLPLLYREKEEGVGVTDLPSDGPACQLLSDSQLTYDQIESWGPSECIAKWAEKRGLIYHMPAWDVVKLVNSKAFSFEQTKPLPGGELIFSWGQLMKWIQELEGPKVLKTCFGLSGQGHLLLPAAQEKIKAFAEKEFQEARPLIAEPWVMRKLDFSTQWIVQKDVMMYVGSTILQSDAKGRYSGTIIGSEEKIFGSYFDKLEEHKEAAMHALKKMAALGFYGHVGIDAMIWGSDVLHPIVEINARKTMGWIALEIRKRLFANQTIQVSYETIKEQRGLLPEGFIKPNGEVKRFKRNLYVDVLA
ncbi:MAG: hypothetical protein KBA81_02475 [Rhabdochlamydiaceae bacterium]|nr:hypothetical protein [Rhabdochlamydiaceae bacterium]